MPPSALPALSMPATCQVSDCTSSQSQPLDCTPSPHSSLDPDCTSLPQESDTNEITPSMEITKFTQAGFPFLSLRPEIRNMIYHYIFTPVRDGTCLAVYADRDVTRLRGFRRNCCLCRRSTLTHMTCQSEHVAVEDMFFAFDLSGNYTHSGILQTCSTTLKEAASVSIACMHISIDYSSASVERLSRALQVLLVYMRQPKEAYLSVFTCTYHDDPGDGDGMKQFSQMVNGLGIRIGHLVLCAVTSSLYPEIGQYFVSTLDRLIHKPAKVERAPLCGTSTTLYRFNSQRIEFNEAARKWLENLAKVKTSDPTARLPLLRDSLPHFFEESAS
jgi:hypothetical protein